MQPRHACSAGWLAGCSSARLTDRIGLAVFCRLFSFDVSVGRFIHSSSDACHPRAVDTTIGGTAESCRRRRAAVSHIASALIAQPGAADRSCRVQAALAAMSALVEGAVHGACSDASAIAPATVVVSVHASLRGRVSCVFELQWRQARRVGRLGCSVRTA